MRIRFCFTLLPRAALCIATGALCIACSTTPTPAAVTASGTTTDRASYGAKSTHANVIFVRHTSSSEDPDFVVLDASGNFVATLSGDMHTVVELEPGDHAFYVLAENSEPLRATLEAGRTYVVETRPHAGFSKGTGVVVEAVAIERLAEVRGWVSTTPAMIPNRAQGQAWVKQRKRQIQQKIATAEADWARKDVFWRKKHTVRPTNGLTADQLGL